jgi:hypothetical protein
LPPQYAPVALFSYRRTTALSRALDALERCPEFSASKIFVFSDGARDARGAEDVEKVRAMLRARLRQNMILVESETNLGLAASVIGGVSRLCDKFGRTIVLEDDLIVAPDALTWLNAGLDRFADDPKVWQVVLHQWDVPEFASRREGMFLHLTSSWGWATWKRAWDRFDTSAPGWRSVVDDPAVRKRFDIGGVYPYSEMLERALRGTVDSWAVRFWWSVFCAEGVSLFPPRPLVANVGFDSFATNYRYGLLRGLLKREFAGRVCSEGELVVPTVRKAESLDDHEAIARAIDRSRRGGILRAWRV